MTKKLELYNLSNICDSDLVYHSRLTHKILCDATISSRDLSKSHLGQCTFRNVIFIDCSISTAEILGSRFIKCTFNQVLFDGTDINSTSFENCSFTKCHFDRSNIMDSVFLCASIAECSFDSTNIYTTQFNESVFNAFIPTDASINSNDFYHCKFFNSKILNSFYYSLFDKCRFIDTIVDSYTVGYQYGIKSNNINNSRIEHFGTLHVHNWLSKLRDLYIQRGMVFQEITTHFVVSNHEGELLEQLYHTLADRIEKDRNIRLDDIRFIRRLTLFFYNKKRIENAYFIRITSIIKNSFTLISKNYGYQKSGLFNEMMALFASISLIYNEILASVEKTAAFLYKNYRLLDSLSLCIAYKVKPKKRLSDMAMEICGNAYLKIINEYKGSFIEELFVSLPPLSQCITAVSFLASIFTLFDFGAKIIKAIKKRAKEDKSASAETNAGPSPSLFHATTSNETIVIHKSVENETIIQITQTTETVVQYSKYNIKGINIK